MDDVKTGLPPIARPNARLFILGSLPGDASLAVAQYYAHPQNQFWRLVGSVICENLHDLAYSDRLERLAEHRIGLWDVIGSAVRRGSLDQAIRLANHNRVERLKVVVIEIGVEPGVNRRYDGNLAVARPADRAMPDDVGR